MNASFRNAWFRTFFPFLQVQAVACLEKTTILSNVIGIPSNYFSNQRLKLKITIGTMNSSFWNAWFRTFFPFLQVEAVACLEKTTILSNVIGIPSSYFSNQRLKLKIPIGTLNSSFWNAWFRTFFRFCKLTQLRVWKKTIVLSTVLGIPPSYFSN